MRTTGPRRRRGRARLLALGALVLAGGASCSRGSSAGPGGPSVLLVTIDTLRADRLGLYGYERDTSPALDALAEQAVVFDRAYSHAPFTAPSHASLFTSLHTRSHGVTYWGRVLDPSAPTFARSFRAAGFRTGAFHNHPGLASTELTRDFETVRMRYFEPADTTVDGFLAWCDRRRGEAFAAWVHLWDVHRPYGFRDWRFEHLRDEVEQDPLVLAYAEDRFGEPWDVRIGRTEAYYNLNAERRAREKDTARGQRQLVERDFTYLADRYDGGVWYADRGFGRLVDGLAERGLLDELVLVVTSDHGEALTERESCLFTHDPFLYEETLRVPLVWRLPGAEHAGRRVPDLVRGVDVLPTLLELCGLDVPATLQGRSLVPLLNGESLPPTFLLARTQTRHAKERVERVPDGEQGWLEHRLALVEGDHKLIVDVGTGAVELYDLAADPGERDDLAGSAEHAGRVAALRRRLEELQRELPAASSLPEQELDHDLLEGLGYLGGDGDE